MALIKRRVFEAFGDEPMFVTLGPYGFPIETDITFCKKARAKGIKLYVDYDIKNVGHYVRVKLNDDTVKKLRNQQEYDLYETYGTVRPGISGQ